jgi:polyphosphate kinase
VTGDLRPAGAGAPRRRLAAPRVRPWCRGHRTRTENEIAFPILDRRLQAEIREVLEVQLSDTAKAHLLQPDGTSVRARAAGPVPARSQERLYELIGSRRD